MYCFKASRFYLLLSLIIGQLIAVNASITITQLGGKTSTYPTFDQFFTKVPYYKYEGVIIPVTLVTKFDDECVVKPIYNEEGIRMALNVASNYSTTAILIPYIHSFFSKCKNEENYSQRLEDFARNLTGMGFPPVKLVIIKGYDDTFERWDAEIMAPIFYLQADDIHSPSMVVTHLKDPNYVNTIWNINHIYTFSAEQETGPWNDLFLYSGYPIYKWLFFSLLLLILSYTFIRAIVMMIRKTMHYNLMFASYIISVVYCICFLIHLANYLTLNKLINDIYNFLSKIPFDLILIHWSIVGRNLFSKKTLILFRVLIGLDITVHTTAFVLRLNYGYIDFAIVELSKSTGWAGWVSVLNYVPIFNALVFLCFAIWFAFNAYRLRRHVEGYHRFMQLMWFCTVCFITYAIFSVCILIYLLDIGHYLSPSEYATYDAIYDTTYLIRTIILLVCLGVAWPKAEHEDEKSPHSPLGGMTTVDHVIKTHVYTTHHPAADGFVNRIT